jgi:putative ABC transport system permease protein
MLGVVIGVATVIIVVAIGLGAQQDVEEQFKNLSVTAISINPINDGGSVSRLGPADAAAVKARSSLIGAATVAYQGKLPVAAAGGEAQITILGVDGDFIGVTGLEIAAGRMLTAEELAGRERLAVIGTDAVEEFFGGDPKRAVGQTMTIAKRKVDIVGVIKPSGSAIGPVIFDESIFVPYDTAARVLLGTAGMVRMIANATDVGSVSAAMDDLARILREEHSLRPSQPDDFRLKDQGSRVTTAQEAARTMAMLLTIVAAVVLLVSGIGIMNVMLVTVTERTREIGVMKAVGAESLTVLWQFLLESSTLSLAGGLIGIALGEGMIPTLSRLSGLTMIPSLNGILLGFLFSVFTGVLFGFYPALKASRRDPVDALRAE